MPHPANSPFLQVLHELLQRDLIQKDEIEHADFLLSHSHGCSFLCMWQKVMNFLNAELFCVLLSVNSVPFNGHHNSY